MLKKKIFRLLLLIIILVLSFIVLTTAETDYEDVEKFKSLPTKQRIKHKHRRGHRLRNHNKHGKLKFSRLPLLLI